MKIGPNFLSNTQVCASDKEKKDIKKACKELQNSISTNKVVTIPVDTIDSNGKLYITSTPDENGNIRLNAKYKNSELCGEVSKCIGYGKEKEIRKYVSTHKNQNTIANLLDSFRATLVEMYLKNTHYDKAHNQY